MAKVTGTTDSKQSLPAINMIVAVAVVEAVVVTFDDNFQLPYYVDGQHGIFYFKYLQSSLEQSVQKIKTR